MFCGKRLFFSLFQQASRYGHGRTHTFANMAIRVGIRTRITPKTKESYPLHPAKSLLESLLRNQRSNQSLLTLLADTSL